MSIIRGPLFKFALVFISFTSLIDLSYARVDSSSIESSAVDTEFLELKSRIAREWNERIPAGFWELSSERQSDFGAEVPKVSLSELERKLSLLQFQFHTQHLIALEDAAGIFNTRPLRNHLIKEQVDSVHSPVVIAFDLQHELNKLGFESVPLHGVDLQDQSSAPSIAHVGVSVGAGFQSEVPNISVLQGAASAFVEAFDRFSTQLDGVESQMISSEGSPEYPRGWQLASYLNHWPTMSWLDSGVQVGNTPLIGRNTIALLESRFGIRFEASAGIIFGRLKSGWKVDLSDRAERPIFIDDSGVLSEQDNDAVDRSFIFMNAAPGVQMVFVESTSAQGNAAVAIPVMTGVATYVDLTHLQSASLSGRVMEKASEQSTWTTLRVVGQERAVTSFQLGQRFKIENVVLAFPYPIYVETDRGEGYTQRYRLLPDQLSDASLTRFSKDRVEKWRDRIAELQNGISPQSGMLVAAFPGLVQEHSELDLSIHIRPISNAHELSPQTYVRAPNGLLNLDHTIAPHEDFIVGAEIPDGPFVLEVLNQDQRVVYSELGFASPGVLNIFNPM